MAYSQAGMACFCSKVEYSTPELNINSRSCLTPPLPLHGPKPLRNPVRNISGK